MTRSGTRRTALAAGAATLILALGVGLGMAVDNQDGDTVAAAAAAAPNAVDIGFGQDMIVHHEQAVVMAQMVRGRTNDPKVAALAAGIEDDQLLDIGALRGYLTLWAAPILPSGPPMSWMASDLQHHVAGPTAMPGMATTAALDALGRATGDDLDRMFLQLMLRHHEGGFGMLADAGVHAAVPAVRALANQMAFHQREETQTIAALLKVRGP